MSQNQPTLDLGGQSNSGCGCDSPSAEAPAFAQAQFAQGQFAQDYTRPGPASSGFLFGGPASEGVELMMRQAAPTLPVTAASAVSAIATWQNDKRVNAMWVIAEDRNAWIGVVGVGWKKLSNANETATAALSMLSAHARTGNYAVNYREEADGMVHEMYVW